MVYGDSRRSELTRSTVRPGQVMQAPFLIASRKVDNGRNPLLHGDIVAVSAVSLMVYQLAALCDNGGIGGTAVVLFGMGTVYKFLVISLSPVRRCSPLDEVTSTLSLLKLTLQPAWHSLGTEMRGMCMSLNLWHDRAAVGNWGMARTSVAVACMCVPLAQPTVILSVNGCGLQHPVYVAGIK
eukprot:CAMPEP_0168197970 /NCGR_PEP_ID=MMETSP0139_2-20121125/21491_1 /TAXON_ID=44445 /ORGANISM="Pseudo-nitzschia australis, Strain 10249 10 AB" /LENGTH=181 /DNA_ID=CAMNT_0008122563 /DNA_START=46 /DNA_END=590 /DNA_ORIENTATION=-